VYKDRYESGRHSVSTQAKVHSASRAQAEQWRALLVGEKDPKSLLTPEGYVQAGERALQRSSRIIRRVVAHFFVPLALLALGIIAAGVVAWNRLAGELSPNEWCMSG
jgi:hypothetical protein